VTLCPQCNGKTTPRHGGPHYDGERYCHRCEEVVEPVPELSDQFMAAADIEAETPITIGLNGIEHVQPSEWAVIGARLERAAKQGYSVSFVQCVVDDKIAAWASRFIDRKHEGRGKTVLEALTAALDAAEGAK